MKSLRALKSLGFRMGCGAALVTLSLSPSPSAAQTTWTGGTGDWFDGANWNSGVPVANEARMLNSGVAEVTTGGATAGSLTLGPDSATQGYVKIIGGDLTVSGSVSLGDKGIGILDVASGTLTANSITIAPTTGEGYLDVTDSTLVTAGVHRGTGLTASFDIRNSTVRASESSANFLSGFNNPEVNLYGVATFDSNGFNITISSPLGGSGDLVKVGTGSLTMTGIYSYGGSTTISGGTLNLGSNTGLGDSPITVDNSLGQGSTLHIQTGVSISNSAGSPVFLSAGGAFINDGNFDDGGLGTNVFVFDQGRVVNNGTMTSSDVVLASIMNAPVSVTNNGLMQSIGTLAGDPVIGVGTGSVVTNNQSGRIISDSSGVFIADQGTVINRGVIDGQGPGMDPLDGVGIYMQGSGSVENSGIIHGGSLGVLILDPATITNSGSIVGDNFASILMGTGGTINNLAGGVIGSNTSIFGAIVSINAPTVLNNAGSIVGNVILDETQNNTVTLYTGSKITGALDIGTTAGSSIVLDGTGSSSFSSAVTGPLIFTAGSLVKQGTGTWNLDQNFDYTGDTIVNQGKLLINGSVAGDVIVNGGILGGNGAIGGSLFNNGGTISVGNSPGILNVGGNFTQSPNGTFLVEAAGTTPGQYDQLNVGGNITLNGGLVLQILPGYVPQIGTVYNFITAGGTISGQFSSFATNLNGSLGARVVYDANGLPQIVIVQGLYSAFAQTPNQRSVANNLDTFSTTGQSPALIALLNSLPGSALPSAYDQIAPDEYGAMSRPILSYNATQQSNLQRRFADLRAGSTGFSANGFTLLGFDRSLLLAGGGDVMAAKIAGDPSKSPMRIAKDNKWGFFVNGSGQFGDAQGDGNGVGYNFTTGGINLGLDYRVSESVVVGGSLGYANSSTDTDGAGGSIQANNAKALLYSSWFDKGFYVNGAVGGGGTSYDSKRNVLGSQVSGDTSGGDFTTFAGGGYDFKLGALTIGPAASLEYSFVNVAGFTERGGLAPLQIQDQNMDSLRSRLGLLASYPFEIAGVRINPVLNAAWQHEFLDTAQTVSARFANGAGGVFNVQSAAAERESAIVGLGVNVEWTPAISTYLSYDAEAAERYLAQSVSGGVKFKF